jgi:hypothetical protein
MHKSLTQTEDVIARVDDKTYWPDEDFVTVAAKQELPLRGLWLMTFLDGPLMTSTGI